MGYRVLLIAVTGKAPSTIHDEYGVQPTATYEETPESPVAGATLPTGAYLLYINDQIVPDNRVFAKLSGNASLVACYANETVMESLACAWVNGVQRWTVYHDAQQRIDHLEADGEVPPRFAEIRANLASQQAASEDVDYFFDIPIELFASLGGIRYNEDIEGAGTEPWQVLTRAKKPKWWWPFG